MRCRPTATRCGASPPKRVACCSRWHRRISAYRSRRSAVSDGVVSTNIGDTADRERHLRRADRRQEVQRHAHRPQHRRHHRPGAAQAGAGDEERRQVAAPRRHSGEGERHAALGRGHESARHAARAQRPAAGCRRHAEGDRRIVREGCPRFGESREPRQLRRGGLRARGAGDPRRATVEGRMDAAGRRAVSQRRTISSPTCDRRRPPQRASPSVVGDSGERVRGSGRPSSRRSTTCRSRVTPRSVPRMRSPIRRTGSSRSIPTT